MIKMDKEQSKFLQERAATIRRQKEHSVCGQEVEPEAVIHVRSLIDEYTKKLEEKFESRQQDINRAYLHVKDRILFGDSGEARKAVSEFEARVF